jgi:hypothetical protein
MECPQLYSAQSTRLPPPNLHWRKLGLETSTVGRQLAITRLPSEVLALITQSERHQRPASERALGIELGKRRAVFLCVFPGGRKRPYIDRAEIMHNSVPLGSTSRGKAGGTINLLHNSDELTLEPLAFLSWSVGPQRQGIRAGKSACRSAGSSRHITICSGWTGQRLGNSGLFTNQDLIGSLVPRRGLEPPRPCERQHLKLVRLPIPPSGHGVGGGA